MNIYLAVINLCICSTWLTQMLLTLMTEQFFNIELKIRWKITMV